MVTYPIAPAGSQGASSNKPVQVLTVLVYTDNKKMVNNLMTAKFRAEWCVRDSMP